MSVVPKIVVDLDHVSVRLTELGLLTVEEFHAALLESNLSRSTCTKLDPLNFRGTVTWAVAVRGVRRIGIPKGFTPRNKDGLSLTVRADKLLALAVATGTSGTGRTVGTPKTRSPKGKKMLAAIEAPGMQLALEELLGPQPEAEPDPEIWFLLLRHLRSKRNEHRSRIYAEVSKPHPDGIDKQGRIVGWMERIILPHLDIDDGSRLKRRSPETGPKFDVEVVRKAI